MKTSIEELYMQYEHSIEKQKQAIMQNRLMLKQAQQKHNFSEASRLSRLSRLLYEEKLEMESAAVSLRAYLKKIPHKT